MYEKMYRFGTQVPIELKANLYKSELDSIGSQLSEAARVILYFF